MKFPEQTRQKNTRLYARVPGIWVLFYGTLLFSSCDMSSAGEGVVTDTTSYTRQKGVLTALVDNSTTSYFIYRGQPLGFEYEMLKLFAKEQGLDLRINIINDIDHILDTLAAGIGDVAAANLTINRWRSETVSFTEPLFRTRQVLVQRLPETTGQITRDEIRDQLITDRLDLAGRDIYVRHNSSYKIRLENFIEETNTSIHVRVVPGDVITEKLIEMVANKQIDYTVSDENKARIAAAYYDNIDISTPMSLSEPIGWAVNKHATRLREQINEWIKRRKGTLEYNVIWNKYFKINARSLVGNYEIVKSGRISKYDDLIKTYATKINWDWILLSAQVYRESHFDPMARSWQGAVGLMQVLPSTGESFHVEPGQLTMPEYNLRAGTGYLNALHDHWRSADMDSANVIRFTLASYNAGIGHIEDAQRLAKKYGYQDKVWSDNVETMILRKSEPEYYEDELVRFGYCRGREPVEYVDDILNKYALYLEFVQRK